jgi:hypothetical protein
MLIGKIKIEPAGMLGDAGIDRALGTIKLRAGFESRSSADRMAAALGADPVAW